MKLQKLNAAYQAVKNKSAAQSEAHYRSDEYRALKNYRRLMKRRQNRVIKTKKSRREKDARYYKKKKMILQEIAEDRDKRATEQIIEMQQAMDLDEPAEQHLDEIRRLKDDKQILTE